jgi:hypothetical protein
MLVSDGEDLRKLPLSLRKTNLARLLARRVDAIPLSDVRAGRDRAGPVPARLPAGTGRDGLQASRLIAAAGSDTGSRSRAGSIPAFSRVQDPF